MSYKFTHSPFVFDAWVPFNGHRFKNTYMIRTRDGREFESFPNGGAWSQPNNEWLEDSEVLEIKLLSKPSGRDFHHGAARLKRDIEYFGRRYPVWCGDTFVWEDELPPGFRISPTEVYGERITAEGETYTKLYVARGIIVPELSHHHRLTEIEGYAQDPLFWWDDSTKIFSHADICNGIHFVHLHRQHILEDKEMSDRVDELCNKLFKDKSEWVPLRHFLVDLIKQQGFDQVKANLQSAIMLQNDTTNQTRWKLLQEQTTLCKGGSLKIDKGRLMNELRGGRAHHIAPTYDLHHVLIRPDIRPDGGKTKDQLDKIINGN